MAYIFRMNYMNHYLDPKYLIEDNRIGMMMKTDKMEEGKTTKQLNNDVPGKI